MKDCLSLLLLLLLVACKAPHCETCMEEGKDQPGKYKTALLSSAPAYKVIKIKDGDTFVVLMDNKEQVVRLAHIDCPEKKQPFGTRAKQFVSDLCFGTYVTLVHHKKYDRNKRLIAEVILEDGRNLNKALVENGLAWHYKKYSDNAVYAKLEAMARQQRTGLWADKDPVAPWLWRK